MKVASLCGGPCLRVLSAAKSRVRSSETSASVRSSAISKSRQVASTVPDASARCLHTFSVSGDEGHAALVPVRDDRLTQADPQSDGGTMRFSASCSTVVGACRGFIWPVYLLHQQVGRFGRAAAGNPSDSLQEWRRILRACRARARQPGCERGFHHRAIERRVEVAHRAGSGQGTDHGRQLQLDRAAGATAWDRCDCRSGRIRRRRSFSMRCAGARVEVHSGSMIGVRAGC